MNYALVVIHPFALAGKSYTKGQRIDDAEEIAAIEASDSARCCNKVSA